MFERNGEVLYRRFAKYFAPTILMTMALSMSIIIDGIIVGNILGPKALAAVNLALPLTMFFNVCHSLFGIGGSTLVAYYKGKRDAQSVNEIYTASLVGMLVMSVLITVLGIIFLKPICNIMTGGNELTPLASRFMVYFIWGAPFFMVLPGIVYFVRTDGQPHLASSVLIVANVVNLTLDIIFLKVFHMDIGGAALSTVLGYVVGSLMLLPYYLSKKNTMHFVLNLKKFAAHTADILKTGTSSALGKGLLFFKTLFINNIVLAVVGPSGMVAFSVCLSCLSMISMFIAGASQTMMPIVGMLYGEKDYNGISFTLKRALSVIMLSSVICVAVFELFPAFILGLFGVSSPADLAISIPAIRIFSLSLPGVGFSFLMIYYTQTIQRPAFSSVLAVLQGLAIVVPLAFILSKFFGAYGIWSSFVLTEIITFIIILCAAHYLSVKSSGKIKGLYMLPASADEHVLEFTIQNKQSDAIELSEKVIKFCLDNGINDITANYVGLAIEEMATNTIKYSYQSSDKTNYIDIFVRILEDTVIVSLREDGAQFDPTKTYEEEEGEFFYHGINLVKTIAEKVEYSYTLGLNCILIYIKKER